MKISKALSEAQYCNEKTPIVRQCCECKKFLDEASKILYLNRDTIKHVVSHGYCRDCANELIKSFKTSSDNVMLNC